MRMRNAVQRKGINQNRLFLHKSTVEYRGLGVVFVSDQNVVVRAVYAAGFVKYKSNAHRTIGPGFLLTRQRNFVRRAEK